MAENAAVGIGPALALIEAVRNQSRYQVYAIADTLGVEAAARSVAELAHRMLDQADFLRDSDELIELNDLASRRRWAYYEIAIRWVDRKFFFTPAQFYAQSFAATLLTHYIISSEVDLGAAGLGRPILQFNPVKIRAPRQFTLGIAYFATLLAIELAAYEQVDLDERIKGYRAYAAQESLTIA